MIDNKIFYMDKDQREKLFFQLYKKYFITVCKYISKRGGSLEDAKDVFQDTIVVYYEKLLNQSEGRKIINDTYLVGIAKILWIRKNNAQNNESPFDISSFELIDSSTSNMDEDKLMSFLERAGEKCMQLLQSVYYNKLSM